MSKAFIAAVLQDSMGSTAVAAKKTADELIEAIVAEIETTGSFTLPGFGTFRLTETRARTGQNPRTREKVQVPAGRTVRFKASPALKGRLTPKKPAAKAKTSPVKNPVSKTAGGQTTQAASPKKVTRRSKV